MRSVLITGGLGFIGLNLAEELKGHGYSVILFDSLSPQVHGDLPRLESPTLTSPNVSVVRGDVTDASALRAVLLSGRLRLPSSRTGEKNKSKKLPWDSHYDWY